MLVLSESVRLMLHAVLTLQHVAALAQAHLVADRMPLRCVALCLANA